MGVWDQGSGRVEIDAPREVQARPQVYADPQQGMLRPARGTKNFRRYTANRPLYKAGDWLAVLTPLINDLALAANEYLGGRVAGCGACL